MSNTTESASNPADTARVIDNVDPKELEKFSALAHRWWDPNSEFKPLHEINPLRLNYIDERSPVAEKVMLDVGCGGGLISEGLALRGAKMTGIDMAEEPLNVARLHQMESGVEVEYRQITTEEMAEENPEKYDILTCLEMLEHVPDPSAIVKACAKMVKPGGHMYFSTINRNPKAYLFAVVGAEYVLNLLPKGTHEYGKFIKPSELSRWAREAGCEVQHMTGLTYNPLFKTYKLTPNVDVNYMIHVTKPA